MIVNSPHYGRLALQQTMDAENFNIADVLDHIFAEEISIPKTKKFADFIARLTRSTI